MKKLDDYKEKTKFWFCFILGIILAIIGIILLIKNFLIIETSNGYEVAFGIEFIGMGFYIVHGEFKKPTG